VGTLVMSRGIGDRAAQNVRTKACNEPPLTYGRT